LKHELDAVQVYFWSEVEAFARVFYKPVARQSTQDHAGMQLHLQPAVDRFKAMTDEPKRSEFREKATANDQVIKLQRANPFDKFQLGLRQIIEAMMVLRMADNDKIVSRYMDDKEFSDAAFTVLSNVIYDSIPQTIPPGGQ